MQLTTQFSNLIVGKIHKALGQIFVNTCPAIHNEHNTAGSISSQGSSHTQIFPTWAVTIKPFKLYFLTFRPITMLQHLNVFNLFHQWLIVLSLSASLLEDSTTI